MYADRYTRKHGLNPGGMALALGVGGLMMLGMVFAAPNLVRNADDVLRIESIPLPPPNEPPPPRHRQPHRAVKPVAHMARTDPLVPLRPIDPVTFDPGPIHPPGAPDGIGDLGVKVDPVKPPLPVLVGAQIDDRYAGTFQPPYPPGEARAGNEGRVVVRVLVGVDGRVRRVERVSATGDDFYAVTERRALDKWRFRPATRDGVPEEAWRTISVTFVLNG